ncbi:MAG: hypothetical protein HY360_10165 [Verrucomicrobia bacterium]|nr:hypothetical protein [Verrucomicrobiota bacterium]
MANEFHWGPTNPHPLSRMRTELVWEGKYDEHGKRREVDTRLKTNIGERIWLNHGQSI